jgi:acyl-CoA reductase-like NAD-dependent aldehyde dehydrogenase
VSRIRVHKTLKMYVGGQFIRSESGRVVPTPSSSGESMSVCQASRKDLRDAVRTARTAQATWAAATAFNRGQVLYRLAEMLEDRLTSLPTPRADAELAVDRAVHHAGWTDKVTAVLSSVNPVASGHVNYSMLRPVGVVVAVPQAVDGLLGMVEAVCAALVMGNSVILIVQTEQAELATAFAEAIATSDVPAGVVNVLTGDVPAALEWADKHDDVDAIYVAGAALSAERFTATQLAGARVIRRLVTVAGAKQPADPIVLQRLAEVKTVWMSS